MDRQQQDSPQAEVPVQVTHEAYEDESEMLFGNALCNDCHDDCGGPY